MFVEKWYDRYSADTSAKTLFYIILKGGHNKHGKKV